MVSKDRSIWARDISEAWIEARERFIGVGRRLIKAKAALPHGEYQKMIEAELPFDASVARKLVAIAKDGRLTKRAHAHVLPGSWTALYELAKLSDDQFNKGVKEGAINAGMTRQDVQRLRQAPLPGHAGVNNETCTVEDLEALAKSGKRYGLIAADPAWLFETFSDKGKDRAPDCHYRVTSIEDHCAMPVKDLAADDCVLLIWIYAPLLHRSFEIIEAWGFEYKTYAYDWRKVTADGSHYFNTYFWTQSDMELCLLATRGAPKRLHTAGKQPIIAARREHSEKPEEFYQRSEQLFTGPRLELFARKSRQGWTCWGDEIGKADMEDRT